MKRTARRVHAISATTAAVALVLTGCSSASSGTSASGDSVTLIFANADPAATWQAVIDGYEKLNPKVKIKQLNIPYAQFTSTINQRMTQPNSNIDLFVVDTGVIEDFSNRGFLADLSDMKADATAAAVSPDMITANVVNGKLLAIEPWTTSQFLFYNKDALAKAGVTAPSADPSQPWTWEKLKAAAQKVKYSKAAQYPLLFDQFDTYYQLQPLGVSAGGGNGRNGAKVDYTNDGWQKALNWYGGLFTNGLAPRGITNDKTGALFGAGKAAFLVSGPWGLGTSVKGKLKFGIAPEPYFEGGKQATSTDSWSVGVSAKSKQQDAAKKFLRYMTLDPKGNELSASVAGITPTQKDAYAKYAAAADASAGSKSKNFGAILEYQLKHNAVHRPHDMGYTIFEPESNKMFSDIRNGANAMEAAKKADGSIEAQLARLK